jgi:hypothetical protein
MAPTMDVINAALLPKPTRAKEIEKNKGRFYLVVAAT